MLSSSQQQRREETAVVTPHDRPRPQTQEASHEVLRTPKKPNQHSHREREAQSHAAERVARRASFLERAMEQHKRQEAHVARQVRHLRQQQQKQEDEQKHRDKKRFLLPFSRSGGHATAGKPTSAPDNSARPGTFAVYSSCLRRAPDNLHYVEDDGGSVVHAGDHWHQPLCVMLIQRRQVTNASDATSADVGSEQAEEVVVRYLPMVDLLTAIKRSQRRRRQEALDWGEAPRHVADGLRHVHDGKEGLTTMHLEVEPGFSFLPEHFKADQADDGEGERKNSRQVTSTAAAEPSVYDYFIPPVMRHVELLQQKHKGGVAYIRHKLHYTKTELEEMARQDRRSYLACERRFLFMRQLQRDLQGRLENEQRFRRRQQQRQRQQQRRREHLQRQAQQLRSPRSTPATANAEGRPHEQYEEEAPMYTTDDAGNVGYDGNNLYVTGREIPEDLVQTFFSLNDEYEAFQRSLERQRRRRQRSGSVGDDGGGVRAGGEDSRGMTSAELDAAACMMRWGDALLFPGQRPADGFVVVTAGPRGMRGWRRVLTGGSGGTSRTRNQHGRVPPRHIDLYAMAQRTAADPSAPRENSWDGHHAAQAVGGAAEDEQDDPYSYMRHFRYQLFYANDSDVDSDEDLLCGESDADNERSAATSKGRDANDGPVNYGSGYYLPRPASA